MKQKEKELIYQYWHLKDLRLSDDVATYEDRYKIRKCDEVDHLESIIAITRQKKKCLMRLCLRFSKYSSLDRMTKEYLKIKKIGALNELLCLFTRY